MMNDTLVFRSDLPRELNQKLDYYTGRFKVPDHQVIEKALVDYLEKISKAEYACSFRQFSNDDELKLMAEKGLDEYLKIIDQ